jgi:predicted porin
MKKLILISAIAFASATASAQSSVLLFGVVDAMVQHGSGSLASFTGLGSGGSNTSSRWGLRGDEDLGGGLKAGFWLESQILVNTGAGGTTSTNNQSTGNIGGGALTFNRRSTVSLLGSFGELRLGRDYSVQYHNRSVFDPFSNNGVGATQTNYNSPGGPVSTRVSNAVMYFLPATLGGVYGEAQYYMGNNPSNAGATAHAGNGGGVRAGYKSGPFDVAAAYARTTYARTATTGDITSSNIGGRWEIGPVAAMAGYFRDKVDATTPVVGTGWHLGGIWFVGAGEVKALLSRYGTDAAGRPESTKVSLGYLHNLSKRTALYGTWARVRNSGGAATVLNSGLTAANQVSSGFDLGVRTSF